MADQYEKVSVTLNETNNKLVSGTTEITISDSLETFIKTKLGGNPGILEMTKKDLEKFKNLVASGDDTNAQKIIENHFSGGLEKFSSELKDGKITVDGFKYIIDSVKDEPNKEIYLSGVFNSLNSAGIKIETIKGNKVTLSTGTNGDASLANKKNEFEGVINNYISDGKISINDVIKSAMIRSASIDEYISVNSDSNGQLNEKVTSKDYALHILKKYKISFPDLKEGEDVFTWIESKKAATPPMTEPEYLQIRNLIQKTATKEEGKNTIADIEYLTMYFDSIYYDNTEKIDEDYVKEYDKSQKEAIKKLDNISDEVYYAMGIKNPDAMKQKALQLQKDPLGLITESLNNGGGYMGALFGIIALIFGKGAGGFFAGLAGGLGVGAVPDFISGIWGGATGAIGEGTEWLFQRKNQRLDKHKDIINDIKDSAGALNIPKVDKMFDYLFDPSSKEFLNVNINTIYNANKSSPKTIGQIFDNPKMKFKDKDGNELTGKQLYAQYGTYIDQFFEKMLIEKPLKNSDGSINTNYEGKKLGEYLDTDKLKVETVAPAVDGTVPTGATVAATEGIKNSSKEKINSTEIEGKSIILGVLNTNKYSALKIETLEKLYNTSKLETIFKAYGQEDFYKKYEQSILQIVKITIDNETDKAKTLKQVLI